MEIDTCETKITLYLSARNLLDADFFTKSDPFAVVYLSTPAPSAHLHQSPAPLYPPISPTSTTPIANTTTKINYSNGGNPSHRSSQVIQRLTQLPPSILHSTTAIPNTDQWEEIGRTETIRNCLSPSWTKSITLTYFFERSQKLLIRIYDRDSPSEQLKKHDFLGECSCTIPQIVRSPGRPPCRIMKLNNKQFPTKNCGEMIVMAEEVVELKKRIRLGLRGEHIKLGSGIGRGVLNKSKPWIRIARKMGDGWKNMWVCGRGVEDKKKGEWTWEKLEANLELFCRCDETMGLRFQIGKTGRNGKEKILGETETCLYQLKEKRKIELFVPGETGRKRKLTGILHCDELTITEHCSFLDFIMGGLDISLIIAIDFTASNGSPYEPNTLHYLDQYIPNEYEQAIRNVGDILAEYDKDQRFPAFGFGAKLPPDHRLTLHCFSLTGNRNPVCSSIDGVLEAYRQTLYNVKLSGPTIFSEIVRVAAQYATMTPVTQEKQTYTILLVLTDGVINDMEATKAEIAKASTLPLSIVIIGIGHADFTDMNELDGDLHPFGERDIVQFVPFSAYKGAPDILATKVLEEIPGQVVGYMEGKGIRPGESYQRQSDSAYVPP